MMNDDKDLKDFFKAFNPDLSPDNLFMERLQRSMEAFEIVKRHNEAIRNRNRKAVAIAAMCGFAAGAIMAILLPCLGLFIPAVHSFTFDMLNIRIDTSIVMWLAVGIVSAVTALNAYDIAIVRISSAHNHNRER